MISVQYYKCYCTLHRGGGAFFGTLYIYNSLTVGFGKEKVKQNL